MHGNCKISKGEQFSLVVEQMDEEIYDIVEKAVDYSFSHKFPLKSFYTYLKHKKYKRMDVQQFLESSTVKNIEETVDDLTEYLKGGQDRQHKTLKEAYGFLGKPEARKVKTYLQKIIDDARQYHYDRRPGRRKKQSK